MVGEELCMSLDDEQQSKAMRFHGPLLLSLVLLCWAGVAEAQRGASASPPGVIVARATTVPFPLAVEALGTAKANESVEIRPQVSQPIRAIHFEEGQRVEAGQILVELDNAEARADVAVARANLIDMENKFRRARDLYESRSVSASELDQRRAQRDAARAELNAAEARLSDSDVRAPFAGRVGLRYVSLGSLVTPQTIITTLDDTDTIKLDFDVPETWLARLARGLPVEARSAAWPDEGFRGLVASIDTRVDPVSRTVTVRALIPNEAEHLRPGMFLTVTLLREDVVALVVPEQAIVPEQSQQFVFVVGDAQRIEKREVRTGRRRPGQVEILAGLAEGERVVAEGTQKARAGKTVEVVGEIDPTNVTAKTSP
jgi:membrane fusion protein (multidrug efflux system)